MTIGPYERVCAPGKNKIAPGFCQGRCAAPWYHLASRPAHAGGLMKCRYTSALLRAHPSEPKAQEALDPAAPEPCSPIRPAPAFTRPGSLWRSKMGYSFLHCHFKILSENFFEIFRQTGLIFPPAGGNSARLF